MELSGGDFKQTFIDGETLPISWEGWSSVWTDTFLDNVTVADLWVTSYNYKQYQYSQLLTSNTNITNARSYTWTIEIASTSLANTAEYVLRFLPPHVEYNTTSVQISSPGFIVIQKPATTTSAATSTVSTSVSITNTASTTLTPTTRTIPSPTSNASSTGLSVGAKAGIGVGPWTIGVAAIIRAS